MIVEIIKSTVDFKNYGHSKHGSKIYAMSFIIKHILDGACASGAVVLAMNSKIGLGSKVGCSNPSRSHEIIQMRLTVIYYFAWRRLRK